MLGTERRSRRRSVCNATVIRLRLTVAKPCRTNSLVSSLTSELLVYSILICDFCLCNSVLLVFFKDFVLRYHTKDLIRHTTNTQIILYFYMGNVVYLIVVIFIILIYVLFLFT